jgi:hypothetical protein
VVAGVVLACLAASAGAAKRRRPPASGPSRRAVQCAMATDGRVEASGSVVARPRAWTVPGRARKAVVRAARAP